MYYEKYLKNKIKSYEGIISIHFHDGGTPEKGSHCICLLEILIDTVFKLIKNYYPQVLFSFFFLNFYMNIVHTNKYNKKLLSPGALNIKETPGYKQKENVKK